MNNLIVLNDVNGYKLNVLQVISAIAIICAILVIINKNPVISVLFLIGLFLSVSSYLMMIGLHFIGLSYLLVYVGAVSILFLFILMLINVRISELLSDTNKSIPLAILIGIAFNYIIQYILPFSMLNDLYNVSFIPEEIVTKDNNFINYLSNDLYNVSFVTSKLWDGNLMEITHISSIGNILYTNYAIWILLTSIILLLAMVGAIVITIKNNYLDTK